MEPDSQYIHGDFQKGTVLISSAYKEKFGIQVGDTVTLKEEYEDTTYSFTVTGEYDYMGALALFLPRQELNETFDLGKSYFCGYFSDAPIQDIDEKYIGTVLDVTAQTAAPEEMPTNTPSLLPMRLPVAKASSLVTGMTSS